MHELLINQCIQNLRSDSYPNFNIELQDCFVFKPVSLVPSCWKRMWSTLGVYMHLQKSQMLRGVGKHVYPTVPARLVETWVCNSNDSLEMPKSATLATKFSSSRMLVGFTSRCIMGGSYEIWKQSQANIRRLDHLKIKIKQTVYGQQNQSSSTIPQILTSLK